MIHVEFGDKAENASQFCPQGPIKSYYTIDNTADNVHSHANDELNYLWFIYTNTTATRLDKSKY